MKYLLILLSFGFFKIGFCQNTKVFCRQISSSDGQPLGLLRCIEKDKYGFVWVGTENGLFKLIGSELRQYSSNNIPDNICGNDVSDLIIPQKLDEIITIQALAGISHVSITNGKVTKKDFLENSKNRGVYSTCELNNRLYIITIDGNILIYNFKKKLLEKEVQLKLPTNNSIRKIFAQDGKIIVASEHGELIVINPATLQIVQKIELPDKDLLFWKYNIKNTNDVNYFSTASGIYCLLPDRQNKFKAEIILSYNPKYGPIVDFEKYNDELLVATEKGLYFCRLGNWKKINLFSNENFDGWQTNITQLKKDGDAIWLLTGKGLAYIKTLNSPFEAYNQSQYKNEALKITHNLIYYNNEVLIGGNESQIDIINLKSKELVDIFPVNNLYKFHLGLDNNIYGVSETDKIKIEKMPGAKLKFKISKVINTTFPLHRYMISFNDSMNFFLDEKMGAVCQYNITNGKTKTVFKSFEEDGNLNSAIFRNLKITTDSTFCFIISDQILEYNISTKALKKIELINPETKKPYIIVMDIIRMRDSYFIAINGTGIAKIDESGKLIEMYGTGNGFLGTNILNLSKISEREILVTSDNGLYVFNVATKKAKLYNIYDGLASNIFLENSIIEKNKEITLGGVGGVTVITPSKIISKANKHFLYFYNIKIDRKNTSIDTSNILIKKIDIPNDFVKVKINFIALNYQNTDKISYQYKITELNNNWIDLKTQNFIDLIGISPGKYHLQVKAANEDGVESKPIELALHFLPKWYQTLLFKILTALTIAMVLFALYKFRIGQLKKVLRVRQKISQNLHDDIGSTLSAINLYTQVAKLKDSNNSAIDNIDANTKEVLDKLDDIIWATNPKNDKIKNLVERMEGFAKPLLNTANINFNFTHNETINEHQIGEAIRQNLFIIFKETINNLVKHAKCTNCTVSLTQKNKTIFFSITDDGIGFDPTQPTQRNGLINMQLRVKELKGKITINSKPGKGSSVAIQLPL